MLHPSDALARILESIEPLSEAEEVPLADAAGRLLARPAVSDVDLPPFEKSMMDGYALRSSERQEPGALRCVGESRAGAPFDGTVGAGECVAIYTGAELPSGLDAVEQIERTRRDGDVVHFEAAVPVGRHVSPLGEILRRDAAVLSPPRRLSPVDLSVLASVGCDPVPVLRAPRVQVLTTGDELVPPGATPGPGQIREGNTLFLAAACAELGWRVERAGIVRDEGALLEDAFRRALDEGDALITTGGVSVGKYDLVGAAFEAIGVEPVLHKVAIKPGKPIWFGMRGSKPVFGLPGNPVSSLLGFEVFVRPALLKLAGHGPQASVERLGRAHWRGPQKRSSQRQHHLPARLVAREDGGMDLHPLPFRGSADHVSVAEADAFVVIPADGAIEPDELVAYRPLGPGERRG